MVLELGSYSQAGVSAPATLCDPDDLIREMCSAFVYKTQVFAKGLPYIELNAMLMSNVAAMELLFIVVMVFTSQCWGLQSGAKSHLAATKGDGGQAVVPPRASGGDATLTASAADAGTLESTGMSMGNKYDLAVFGQNSPERDAYNTSSATSTRRLQGYQFADKQALRDALNSYCSSVVNSNSTYGPIDTWDTSLVTDMNQLISSISCKSTFNADISGWNVAAVTTM
jgi:hypothetical protein